MTTTNEPDPTPPNQSPDTETDDGPVIDLDELADRMWAKAPEHLRKEKDSPSGSETQGDSDGGSGEGPAADHSTPAPAVPSSGPDVEGLIERTVNRLLGEKDHAHQHEELTKPPEPKPARRGLAAAVWGKDRR